MQLLRSHITPMGKTLNCVLVLFFTFIFLAISPSKQLQSSQAHTLLRIQLLLNYPSALSSWNNFSDFCNTEPNPSLTVVCYEESITQLHIIGKKGAPPLPRSFSIDSFVTTLVKLSNLKVLTLVSLGLWGPLPGKIARLSSLEIMNISLNYFYGAIPQELSSITSLQTLVLDDNTFSGQLPEWIDILPGLTVLSMRKNLFNGSLPSSLSNLENLRVIALSHNLFLRDVPDLSGLKNLQVLDLEENAFGPNFPKLGSKLVSLVLRKNRFRSAIPSAVSSFYQLERLDLSFNSFVGPFPASLLSLPSITYMNIAGNKFTGMLFENQSCNDELKFVDLSSNLLSGSLPGCLQSNVENKVVLYGGNCFTKPNQYQHPLSFCSNEALAVGILPRQKGQKRATKVALALGITGGIVGGIALVVLVYLFIRRFSEKNSTKALPIRYISENASTRYTSKLLSDARYISQTMKLGALGLPAYRTFSLEEIEEATNYFDTSAFMVEGSHGQMYRGQLKGGTLIAIRCLKMKKSQTTQSFTHLIELVSKLRHRNLVSAIGHCFEFYLDDSSVSRIFLVFEYVPNGTLRSWISEGHPGKSLSWTQRIAVAIGVAKGIQFLHTGIVPGMYLNNLKITDILLDSNLVAKIRSCNLPLLVENTGKVAQGTYSGACREHDVNEREKNDRSDVYDFGVILLEILLGKPIKSRNEAGVLKKQLEESIASADAARKSIVDPAVGSTCLDQSLKTMMEICIRCLMKDPAERPSVEDILWNLQFAAQVQDAWRDPQSSEGSPNSPKQPSPLRLTLD